MENLSYEFNGFLSPPEKIKACPRCHSLFITPNKCEDCGFIPFEARFGKPYDDKSFFSIKDRYWKQAPLWMKLFPTLETKTSFFAQEYKKRLLLRYKHLLSYFAETTDEHPHRQHYLIEFRALIREVLQYPIKDELLTSAFDQIDKKEMGPLWENIAQIIEEKKSLPPNNFLKLAGGKPNLNLIVFMILAITLSAAMLKAFPYFLR